ncbi:FAD/NAD(P)-binding domain-containing protein [Cristinia sonorae]|uniref:FAD/NAD(P)-binding domain-containing protein n=1 Tax=Cristinia sonorae TaxID=1940300 RepID=A0A8K0UWE6_9AGAR|nr:FAD/NAD(P)-binding domain-containing protein [Cristinia sonorae]
MDVDVIILGTDLRNSILAAALSKAGFTVAHIDNNAYYGGDDASLSIDELRQWTSERRQTAHISTYLLAQHARFTSISSSISSQSQSRQFSISLSPTIIPSAGPLVDSLIASGASRYGGFKLLERVALYSKPGFVKTVPGAKEDVFKSTELSLLDKRRLMRFLMFSISEFEGKGEVAGKEEMPFLTFLRDTFSLNQALANAVAYALAFCSTGSDPTLPALQRIRRYLRSAGRYGASPFFVGHYGGAGEIAQGFCRISAVHGGIYILAKAIASIAVSPPPSHSQPSAVHPPPSTSDQKVAATASTSSRRPITVALQGFPEELTCDVLISTNDYLDANLGSQNTRIANDTANASRSLARCIAVIDRPVVFRNDNSAAPAAPSANSGEGLVEEPQGDDVYSQVDTALLIFPPGSVEGGSTTSAVNVLISGEQSLATPKDHWVLHLSMALITEPLQSAEEIMRPYLNATLSLASPRSEPEREATISEPLSVQPLHTVFYIEHPEPSPSSSPEGTGSHLVYSPPPNSTMMPELADSAVANAEKMFWKITKVLQEIKQKRRGVEEGGAETVIESFWPPISDTSVVDQDW